MTNKGCGHFQTTFVNYKRTLTFCERPAKVRVTLPGTPVQIHSVCRMHANTYGDRVGATFEDIR